MLKHIQAANPGLASQMAAFKAEVQGLSHDEIVQKIGDGTIIKALWAYIAAHPEQLWQLTTWIASLFGLKIPPLPLPTPEPAPPKRPAGT